MNSEQEQDGGERDVCAWCGALRVKTGPDDYEWIVTAAQAGCDHEVLV